MDNTAEYLARTILFPSRILLWPPKSPKLTAYNLCLWGALKVRVLQTCSTMLEDKNSGQPVDFHKEIYRMHYPYTSGGQMYCSCKWPFHRDCFQHKA